MINYRWITVFTFIWASFAVGTETQQMTNTENKMKLVSIELEHTNPSMGPHEKKVSFIYHLNNEAVVAQKLLDETLVNSVGTLREYVEGSLAKDHLRLKKFYHMIPEKDLTNGAVISNLYLTFEDRRKVELNDLRKISLSGYYIDTFRAILVAKGSRYESSSKLETLDFLKEDNPSEVSDESSVSKKPARSRKKNKH